MKTAQLFFIGFLLVPIFGYAQNGRWETGREPIPVEKWARASAVVDGKIYYIGGHDMNGQNLRNSDGYAGIHVYDPANNSWDTTRTPMPTARGIGASAVVGGKIYVIGGCSKAYEETLNLLEVYDPVTDTWETKRPMPTARWGCRAAVLDGKIHVIGSSNTNQILMGKHEVYDPILDQWQTFSPVPEPVWDMYLDTLGGEMYAFGGFQILPDIEKIIQIYNPQNDSWRVADTELPYRVGGAAGSSSLSGKIYLIAPTTSAANEKAVGVLDVLMYDPQYGEVLKVSEASTPRLYGPAHFIDGRIYVAGGFRMDINTNQTMLQVCTEMDVYTPVADPIYAQKVDLSRNSLSPGSDSISIQTHFINDGDANLTQPYVHITSSDGLISDSVLLFDDGLHHDGLSSDGQYGTYLSVDTEHEFTIGVSSVNLDNGDYFIRTDMARFTSIGPLIFDGFDYPTEDTVPDPGDVFPFHAVLKNQGQYTEASNVTATINSMNDYATLSERVLTFDDIGAGEKVKTITRKTVNISENCPDNTIVLLRMDILSNGILYWQDTIRLKVGHGIMMSDENIMKLNILKPSIFPNPTTGILHLDNLSSPARVKVFSVDGQLMKSINNVQSSISIEDLPVGIYMLKINIQGQVFTKRIIKN